TAAGANQRELLVQIRDLLEKPVAIGAVGFRANVDVGAQRFHADGGLRRHARTAGSRALRAQAARPLHIVLASTTGGLGAAFTVRRFANRGRAARGPTGGLGTTVRSAYRPTMRSKRGQLLAFAFLLVARHVGAQPMCVGDCDGSGVVTIDEILTGVNIALDR